MSDLSKERKSGRLGTLGRACLFMFGCAVALMLASGFIPKLSGMWSELWLGVTTSLITLGLTIVFARWDGVRLEDVGAVPNGASPLRLLMGFAIGSFVVAAWALASMASGYVRWSYEPKGTFASATVALLAYLALASREELAFHGYPLRRLERRFGLWIAQLFVAVAFGLEHRLGGATWPQAMLGAGVGSLLFGMASIATRGLAVPIGMHMAWNFGTWLLGMKGQPGVWNEIIEAGNEGHAEFVGMAAYVAVIGTATLLFWIYFRRGRNVRPSAKN